MFPPNEYGKGQEYAAEQGNCDTIRHDLSLTGVPDDQSRLLWLKPEAPQLRRNGRLPPGLQKKLVPFSVELERKLAPIPVGYRRVTLGTWALLIQDATKVIFDVIDLARR